MLSIRIVPARLKGAKAAGGHAPARRKRNRRVRERRPIAERYEISEVFSMDDDEYTETDLLVDHVLRRGSIKGRPL